MFQIFVTERPIACFDTWQYVGWSYWMHIKVHGVFFLVKQINNYSHSPRYQLEYHLVCRLTSAKPPTSSIKKGVNEIRCHSSAPMPSVGANWPGKCIYWITPSPGIHQLNSAVHPGGDRLYRRRHHCKVLPCFFPWIGPTSWKRHTKPAGMENVYIYSPSYQLTATGSRWWWRRRRRRSKCENETQSGTKHGTIRPLVWSTTDCSFRWMKQLRHLLRCGM